MSTNPGISLPPLFLSTRGTVEEIGSLVFIPVLLLDSDSQRGNLDSPSLAEGPVSPWDHHPIIPWVGRRLAGDCPFVPLTKGQHSADLPRAC